MGTAEFKEQLLALGYEPQEPSPNKICFIFVVEGGKNHGKKVWLGFDKLQDFPMNCPHGPHFKPIDDGWLNPPDGIHQNRFDTGWVHWSRPFEEWNTTNKTVKEYLAHIKNLLVTL